MTFNIDKDTRLFLSLSGRPSNFGTRFHNYLFQRMGLNFLYKAVAISDVEGALSGIRALGIGGCAVSMPFKESATKFVDEIDETVNSVGALNTVVNRDGKLFGYNTDAEAVATLLKSHLESKILNLTSKTLVFGTGGMAKAILYALHSAGFQNVSVMGRNFSKCKALASRFGAGVVQDSKTTGQFDLIINATSVGMEPSAAEMVFSHELIYESRVVVDSVASPIETQLVLAAENAGKVIVNGGDIRRLQAIQQFKLYTGYLPKEILVKEADAWARS